MIKLSVNQITQAAKSLPPREQLKLIEILERKTMSLRWKQILKDIDSLLKKFPISKKDVLDEIQAVRRSRNKNKQA